MLCIFERIERKRSDGKIDLNAVDVILYLLNVTAWIVLLYHLDLTQDIGVSKSFCVLIQSNVCLASDQPDRSNWVTHSALSLALEFLLIEQYHSYEFLRWFSIITRYLSSRKLKSPQYFRFRAEHPSDIYTKSNPPSIHETFTIPSIYANYITHDNFPL